MKIISPDEFLEGFIALIILLIGFGLVVQILTGENISNIISVIIELVIPVFLAGFVFVMVGNIIKEIFS